MTRPARIAKPAALLVLLLTHRAAAAPYFIQPPNLAAMDKGTLRSRAAGVRINRGQGLSPAARQRSLQQLAGMDLGSSEGQAALAVAAPQVRMALFKQLSATAGTPVRAFARRLRGMLNQDGKTLVSHHSKEFVEVTPSNLDLFKKLGGKNMVYFTVTENPDHLHTLLGDQGDRQGFHHNAYGVENKPADFSSYTQFAMGVQLTDHEMDRLVRYMNMGNDVTDNSNYGAKSQGKDTVFGFHDKKNQKVADMRCTNWATTAPIGDLPYWAARVDGRITALAISGGLPGAAEVQRAGGLHAALAQAPHQNARADLVSRVLEHTSLSHRDRKAVRQMAKAFDRVLKDFPNRPADLVLRRSLAETLGLSRSRAPAKWSYDLMLSKRVPVVAVLNKFVTPDLMERTFNWRMMGGFAASGEVVPIRYPDPAATPDQGVIPANRRPQPAPAPATN